MKGSLQELVARRLIAPSAHAATKKPVVPPVCNLITDEKGDTFAARPQDGTAPGPQEDGLDIVSMDVASNATTLTGVIRVAKLANAVSSAPNGIDFRISFTLPAQDPTKENFFLNARKVPLATPPSCSASAPSSPRASRRRPSSPTERACSSSTRARFASPSRSAPSPRARRR